MQCSQSPAQNHVIDQAGSTKNAPHSTFFCIRNLNQNQFAKEPRLALSVRFKDQLAIVLTDQLLKE